eukprot:6490745-Amphidinium_carterae.3
MPGAKKGPCKKVVPLKRAFAEGEGTQPKKSRAESSDVCTCRLCQQTSKESTGDQPHKSRSSTISEAEMAAYSSLYVWGWAPFRLEILHSRNFAVMWPSSCLCPWQEKTWALFVEEEQGKKPAGDQCELCYTLWQRAFQFVSWECLCKQQKENADFAAIIEKGRSALQHEGQGCLPLPETVSTEQAHAVQVQRSYLCLTERDIRRVVGASRLPKAILKGLPTISIPSEDGKAEELGFLFEDPEAPFRKAILSVELKAHCNKVVMDPKNCLWDGQGKKYTAMAFGQLGNESLGSLVAREQGGHLSVCSWESFLQEKLAGVAADGNTDGQGGAEEAYGLEGAPRLVGVAAATATAAAAGSSATQMTDSEKKNKGKTSLSQLQSGLNRTASSSNLPANDGASVTGTVMTMEGSVFEDDEEVEGEKRGRSQ